MRLAEISAGAVITRFGYDGPNLVLERDGANGAVLRRYVHGPGTDEALVWYEGSGTGDRRFLHADERGSIVAVSTGAGAMLAINRYDEYGVPDAGNLGRFQYTGQTFLPELGLYYYKARLYAANLGRFLQTDPIGYDDQINLYAYVANDPVNATDPDGEFGVVGALIGGAVGAVAGYGSEVIKQVRNGTPLEQAAKSTSAIKAGVTGGLTGAVVGSGAGLVTSVVAGAVIGGGVEAAAGEITGKRATAGEVAAAAFNNAVATGLGVAGGKVLESVASAAATAGRSGGAIVQALKREISPGEGTVRNLVRGAIEVGRKEPGYGDRERHIGPASFGTRPEGDFQPRRACR